jgi:hypothetical protein
MPERGHAFLIHSIRVAKVRTPRRHELILGRRMG